MSLYESSIVGCKTNESEMIIPYRDVGKSEYSRTHDKSRGRGMCGSPRKK